MIELAMDGFFRMDYERMRRCAQQALSTARPLGDRPLTAAAVALLAFGNAASGATEEAETHRLEAAELVAELDDSELALRLDAAANLAGAELYLDRYEEAGAHAQRALSVARATGQSEYIPLPYSILGQARLLQGRLAEAGELLDDAVEGARLSGNVQALAGNLVNRSLTALAAGDLELALATAEENVELTQGLDQSLVCAAGVAGAAALLEQGDPQRAADLLVESSGGEDLPLIPGVFRTRSLELLTRCRLALGSRERGRTRRRQRGELRHRLEASHGGFDGRPRGSGGRAQRGPSGCRRRARARLRGRRRRGCRPRRGSPLANARRARARAGRAQRACGRRTATRRRRATRLWLAQIPRRGRPGTAEPRPSRAPAHPSRQTR